MSDSALENEFIQSSDGTRLHVQHWSHSQPKATLLLVHGFCEHIGRYGHVFDWFHGQGYSLGGLDYRGHGQSDGQRSYIDRFEQYVADVDAMVSQLLSKSEPNHKLFLIGHSLGGLIVASYALAHPEGLDGIVLSAPAMRFKAKVPAWKNLLGKASSAVWPTLSIPTGIPSEHLSHDPAVCQAYDADERVNKNATSRWYTETLAQQEYVMTHAERLSLPVLVLQGTEDYLVDPDMAQRFVASVGAHDKEIQWYDGLYHELFNETKKEEVLTDVSTWLDAHV
jgi:alpha-beta hydrolase superfamily lysophospholipase